MERPKQGTVGKDILRDETAKPKRSSGVTSPGQYNNSERKLKKTKRLHKRDMDSFDIFEIHLFD